MTSMERWNQRQPEKLIKLTELYNAEAGTNTTPHNRVAWQWVETLVEIMGTLADIRGTTK